MSLKSFHLFFITASVLTAIGFAAWAGNEYLSTDGGAGLLVMAILSALTGVGLIVYGRAFRKKINELPGMR